MVMLGIRRTLPAPTDTRKAFIPTYSQPSYYPQPPTTRWLIFTAAFV